MSATVQLTTQLATLTDSLKQTNALITRLAKLDFQPGSEPLDAEEDGNSVRIELAQDIHESLKQLEEDLELLKQEVEDTAAPTHAPTGASLRQRSGSVRSNSLSAKVQDRERLNTGVVKAGEDLSSARRAFRRAQLSAKKAAEAAKVRERELVFASLQQQQQQQSSDPNTPTTGSVNNSTADLFAGRSRRQKQQHLTKDQLLIESASDVTASLRRTQDLLSTELQRSRYAQETLDDSTRALKELDVQYTDLSGSLGKARDLVGTLLRSRKSDTWYLETAFWLLCVTLGWLVFRRLLFGPFVLLPRFLWNCTAFILNWVVLKPLFFFLTATGVITSTPYIPGTTIGGLRQATTTRAPLIIQPSAEGRVQGMDERMAEYLRTHGVPAGSGGEGAKVDKYGQRGGLSEEIGRMADRQGQIGSENGGSAKEKEPERRGDGTVLRERGADEPVNPKKKAFEAEEPVGGGDGKEAEGKARRKRDEL